MTSLRLFIPAFALLALSAAPRGRAGEAYDFKTQIYLFKNADVPDAPQVDGAPASASPHGQWSVFTSPVALKFGGETLALEGPALAWTRDSGQPSNFNLISSPEVINTANREAKVIIGENTQYFERLPDGNFRLHEVSAGSPGAAHCDVVLSARPADDAADGLFITCKPDIATVRDRETIPGVSLEVGKPVLASFKDTFNFTAKPGEWSCLFGRAAGGGDYGLLVLLKVTPKSDAGEMASGPATAVAAAIPADVVGDVTAAGKKAAQPAPDKPVYYFPMTIGYRDLGELRAGELTPPPEAIDHVLAEALFARGYRVMTKESPPSIILVFSWGYLSPHRFGNSAESEGELMKTLLNGDRGIWAPRKAEDYDTAIKSDRYYVTVTAVDAADALRHTLTLLWRTQISTAANGISLRDALPTLIAAAGRTFGRDTPPLLFAARVGKGDDLGSAAVAITKIEVPDLNRASIDEDVIAFYLHSGSISGQMVQSVGAK